MFLAIFNRMLLKNTRLVGEAGQRMQLILLMPMYRQIFSTLYCYWKLYSL